MSPKTFKDKQLIDDGAYRVWQVVKFIRKHKRLNDWTDQQIADDIAVAIENETFMAVIDEEFEIAAVGWGHIEKRTFNVVLIIANKSQYFKVLMRWYLKSFQGYTITAKRRGKFITYKNTPELCRKILTLT